ncbi:MAG: CBS domain-containing protein [Enhydrobacter sp.]|nr:CBS domain-containing protein [Enhydrobacter sp.]
MTAPLVTVPATASVAEAARTMTERQVSSVVVLNDCGKLRGILTEHDVLRLIVRDPAQLAAGIAEAMTTPVHGIDDASLVYRAISRMARLGVRHLPVIDESGRPVGMLTARGLLKQRASLALTLGDEIDHAADVADLGAAFGKLPALAAGLRREDVPAVQVAAVIAGVTRDVTARAGELAVAAMRREGRGDAPAAWCLLVLGSAGRGETLLTPDQDNALVHDGDDSADVWFSAFAEKLNASLDASGVPFCKGGVMASNPAFRRSLDRWRAQVDAWIDRPQPESLLNVDIFYDFVPVLGERSLARSLRDHAVAAAARSPLFLRLLAETTAPGGSAFDMLGRLRTKNGRIDLKLRGLLPVVSGARSIALAWGLPSTSTDRRLAEAAAKGALSADAAADLTAGRATLVEAILDQQLADIAAGVPPSTGVEPKRLKRDALQRLRHALSIVGGMPERVREALTNRAPERPP